MAINQLLKFLHITTHLQGTHNTEVDYLANFAFGAAKEKKFMYDYILLSNLGRPPPIMKLFPKG